MRWPVRDELDGRPFELRPLLGRWTRDALDRLLCGIRRLFHLNRRWKMWRGPKTLLFYIEMARKL